MALPCFQTYYWAVNFRNLLYRVQHDFHLCKHLWVQIGAICYSPVTLTSLLCSPIPSTQNILIKNPIVKHSLRIWTQFCRALRHNGLSLAAPIASSVSFPPFNIWKSQGLVRIDQLFINNNFALFDQLKYFFCPIQIYFGTFKLRTLPINIFQSSPLLLPVVFYISIHVLGVPYQRFIV